MHLLRASLPAAAGCRLPAAGVFSVTLPQACLRPVCSLWLSAYKDTCHVG